MSKQKNIRISERTQTNLEILSKKFPDESEGTLIAIALNFLKMSLNETDENVIHLLALCGSVKHLEAYRDLHEENK